MNNSNSDKIFLDKPLSANFLQISFLEKSLTKKLCLGSVAVYHAGLSNDLASLARLNCADKFQRNLSCFRKKVNQKEFIKNEFDFYSSPVTRVRIPAQAQQKLQNKNLKIKYSHGPVTQPGRVSGF